MNRSRSSLRMMIMGGAPLKFAFLLLAICCTVRCCEDVLENHLATKSPYRFVGNQNHSRLSFPGCQPLKVWMLIRHGTRYPSDDYVSAMQTRLPVMREIILSNVNGIFKSDRESLRKWKLDFNAEDAKKLTAEGSNEMVEIAERMQARLPEIFSHIYSNTSYNFKFTSTQRTRASAYYFAKGLFGKRTAKDVDFPEPLKQDPILRFYKLCNKWKKEVKHNLTAMKEATTFKASPMVRKELTRIARKLGVQDKKLSFDDAYYMYMTCAFETAWSRKKKSPWCAPFDVESAKVFEYAEDLKYYWIDGYGHDITYKQACPAFGDMLAHLGDSTSPFPKATLYFTHSGTLLKMLSHLGLYKDERPLKHDNYDEQRLWRSSRIDAFATNLAFVSYKCGNEVSLLALHQEHVVRLPSCPDSDLCPLSKVKGFYEESLNSCSFDAMCNNTKKQ